MLVFGVFEDKKKLLWNLITFLKNKSKTSVVSPLSNSCHFFNQYFSAVFCQGRKKIMNFKQEIFNGFNDKISVFSRHFKSMECEADKLVLRYRYTLDELALLLQGKKNDLKNLDIIIWVKIGILFPKLFWLWEKHVLVIMKNF